jgi:predicted esterase
VLHGWGGNAQMMLPLARPLHEAGFALLLSMHAATAQ